MPVRMNKFLLSAIRVHWTLLALWGLTILSIISWFHGRQIIVYIDDFPMIGGLSFYKSSVYAWSNLYGLGTINVTNFPLDPIFAYEAITNSLFHIPIGDIERIMFLAIGLTGETGIYFVLYSFGFKNLIASRVSSISAAIVYFFNPVFLDLYWYLNFPGVGFVFAFMPWAIYSILRTFANIRQGKSAQKWIFVTIMFITATSTSEIPYIISVYFLVLMFFIIYVILFRGLIRRALTTFLEILGGSISLNAWWLVPEVFVTKYAVGVTGYSTNSDLIDLSANSAKATFYNIFSLRYFIISNSFGKFVVLYSKSVLFSIVLPLTFIISITVAFIMIFLKKKWLKPVLPITMIVSFLFLTFLLMGNNSENPLSSIISVIFVKFFWTQPILRGPYLSFGAAFAFVYSVLFGLTAGFLANLLRFLNIPKSENFPKTTIQKSTATRKIISAIIVIVIVMVPVSYSFEIADGSNVNDLLYPASTNIPPSFYNLTSFLQAHPNNLTVVLPGGDNLVYENWSNGYLGPQLLQYTGSTPVFQDSLPTLGSSDSLVNSILGFLPSYQTNLDYSNILRATGAKYVIVDQSEKISQYTLPFNLTHIDQTLSSAENLSFVKSFGQYNLYEVKNTEPIVDSFTKWLNCNNSTTYTLNLSEKMGLLSSFRTDNSSIWQSDISISNISNNSFNVTGYYYKNGATGDGYPGWPEVTNLYPLNLSIGNYPIISISVRTSNNLTPIVSFSGKKMISVNATNYVATIAQFNGAQLLSSMYNPINGVTNFVYFLGSYQELESRNQEFLNHIMIELQPNSGYVGYTNATISISAGYPDLLSRSFDPSTMSLLPNNIVSQYHDILSNLSSNKVTYNMVSPDNFRVYSSSLQMKNYYLIALLQTYSPGWEISNSSSMHVLAHFPIDGVLNGWLISGLGSNLSFKITFALQQISDFSTDISILTVIAMFSSLITCLVYNRRKQRA